MCNDHGPHPSIIWPFPPPTSANLHSATLKLFLNSVVYKVHLKLQLQQKLYKSREVNLVTLADRIHTGFLFIKPNVYSKFGS